METCKGCIHLPVCETYNDSYWGNRCEHFKSTADVVEVVGDINLLKEKKPTAIWVGTDKLPIEYVPVVRCKDCEYSYFVSSCSKYECRKGCGTLKYSTDFCSYGERKEV